MKHSNKFPSSIVPQKISTKYKRGGRLSVTKSGDWYDYESRRLRFRILKLVEYNPRRVNTIMTFCRNYYVKYQELPRLDDLGRIFKF